MIACWITNIAGLLLMHKGIERVARKEGQARPYTKRDFAKDFAFSLVYTAVIVILVKLHIIRPMEEYFKGH